MVVLNYLVIKEKAQTDVFDENVLVIIYHK